MARQEIDLTTPQPNGKMGEPTKSAWKKVNDMTDEIYQAIPEVTPKEFTFVGTDPDEVMINIRGPAGAIPVLHYNFKSVGSGFAGDGQLIGGAGSRPWAGSGWAEHSAAAYHIIATENHTATLQGADFRILASPIGTTWENRIYVANFNGDGDVIASKGLLSRKFLAADRGKGVEIAREGVGAELSLVSNNAGYSTLFRCYSIGGTLTAPSATLAGQSTGIGLCGWGTTAAAGSAAIIGAVAATNWSDSSRPTIVFIETTAAGSTARTRRWSVVDSGHLLPGADNTYDVGSGSTRIRQFYSGNGTISTSDANLKQDFTSLSNVEIEVGLALARTVGTYRWKESVVEKGSAARLHVGVQAQKVISVMEAHGLDPFAYGIVCHDEWDSVPAVFDEETGEQVCAEIKSGSRYGVRYEQLSMLMSAAIAAKLELL